MYGIEQHTDTETTMDYLAFHNFKTYRRKVTYCGKPVGDFSNNWCTPHEVIKYMDEHQVPESKLFAYLEKKKELHDLAYDLGYFPAKLTKRLKEYGMEPTWANWHKIVRESHGNSLPVHKVKADIGSMNDRQIRQFVREHGPKNLKIYVELHQTLDRAEDPETRDYFGSTPEEQRYEVNNVWRLAALQISGKHFGHAFEMTEDMR
jgi:hypothetical protein